ncbi:hypothetical protein SAMN03003324_00635 [Pedobacter antarcticus]|nr:hypothetical protein [Pedobacter antarcticus]SFE48367.1 hypothetical protein SAMN03003324_00635 [Pedobacter antarcticus]
MRFLLLLFFMFLGVKGADAQLLKEGKLLLSFLQDNADSTVVFGYKTGFLSPPEFVMISKKGDTITAYTYRAPPAEEVLMPHNIGYAVLMNHRFSIYKVPIAVNQFFNPFFIPGDELLILWKALKDEQAWDIQDDTVDGGGCPLPIDTRIYDAASVEVQLLTKEKVRSLSFYAPAFYEKNCPGRNGRIRIMAIEKLFLEHFQFKSRL